MIREYISCTFFNIFYLKIFFVIKICSLILEIEEFGQIYEFTIFNLFYNCDIKNIFGILQTCSQQFSKFLF